MNISRFFILAALVALPIPALAQDQTNAAIDIANRLAVSGLPVKDIKAVTPATDDNKLMGRPGYYTSKIYFSDARYPEDASEIVTTENTIEAFASVEDAKRRADYVGKIATSSPMFAQYVYQSGRFVLRLKRAFEPADASDYQAALVKAATRVGK